MEKLKKTIAKKFVLVSIIGFILISVLIGRSDLYRDISDNWKLVYEVYKRIMTDYADQINPKKLAGAGIKGMLAELDPYSTYLVKDQREGLNMLTKGEYGGVGIHLGVRDDSLTVIAPMEDTPAKRSGILPGDRIIAIDFELTKDMDLNEAANKIRGKKGTKIVLTIRRFGEMDDLDFELTRDNIKIEDVSFSGIIEEDIGYIKLARFSKNSPREMRRALSSLKEQGTSKFILDLRLNPGGLLDAAIKILDLMIEKGPEVLYTKGRNDEADRKFVSQNNPIIDYSIPLVVLIDGGSASASEIVAGVVQDLDRGVVIGTKSFGKGLVQTVYPLDRERSLKLTTAKYYMPSGRLIQKPDYLDEEMMIGVVEEDSVFVTKNGREVLASGGITPDIVVDLPTVPMLTRECWRRGLFFKFASLYVKDHEMTLPIVIDEKILEEFWDYLNAKDIELNIKGEKDFLAFESSLDSTATANRRIEHSLDVIEKHFEELKSNRFELEKEYLSIGLEREFSSLDGGVRARIQSSFDDDPVILRAIQVLGNQVTYHQTLNPSEF